MSAIRLLMRLSLALLLGLSLFGIVFFASLPASAVTIIELTVPTPNSGPFGITVGPDGNLWFTEDSRSANGIGRITTAGVVTEFPIPTPNAIPSAITTGPDGNLWFTEATGNKIGRITTDGVITEFAVPTADSMPIYGITAGPDGNLWFTEASVSKIGRITTDGVITEFGVPTADSFPAGITVGPDGNLWFTEEDAGKIGRIFSVSTPATPTGQFSGITGTPYSFMTGGSTSILGNPVEYQFDWKGDGSDLSAYGSATQSKTWTAAGTYSVRARARDTVNTSVVSNWSLGLSVTITAPAGPNVVISSISGPSTGKPGGRISIQNTVTNQGIQTASNVTVNFYISSDTQIDTGDKLIGKRTISNLAPGGSSGPVSTMVTIPKNITQGFYFIGGIVGNNTNFDPKGITICVSLLKAKLLSPKNKGRNVSRSPALSWSNVSAASSYEVQVATDSGFTNIAASMTGLTSIQWTVTPALSGGTTYFWRARAVNPCGPGPWSMTWSFKTM
jgi:hypothetical protein